MSRSLAAVFLVAVLVMLSLMPSLLHAQIPRIISYQGVLTDTTGHPKPDGTYGFTFSLYAVANGGLPLWSESKSLSIRSGLFATLLGDHVAFSDSVRFDKPYWLGVQVGNDILSPRLQFNAVGYSLNSAHAFRSDTSSYAAGASRADTALYAVNSAATFGSSTSNDVVVENYNGIAAPLPGQQANVTSGITLMNSTASNGESAQNSPALTFSATSLNPSTNRSEISTWSIHRWGFITEGTAGAVLTFTVQRPDPLTISPVAFDEDGRVLLGYTQAFTPTYYGFKGEDFGQWSVILAGPTVVGWPEKNITSDLRVTGTARFDNGLVVGIPEQAGNSNRGITSDVGLTGTRRRGRSLGASIPEKAIKSDLHVTGNTTMDGFLSSPHIAGSATFGSGDSIVVFIDGLTASSGAVATFAEAPVVNNPIFTDNIQTNQITFKSTGNSGKRFWYWIVMR